MQNNKACPNYFNGGTPEQYLDYRLFVISRLPDLIELDIKPVTKEEREQAMKQYGDLTIQSPISIIEEVKKKKELEKRASVVSMSTVPTKVETPVVTPVPVVEVPKVPIPPKIEVKKQVAPEIRDAKQVSKLDLEGSLELKDVVEVKDRIPLPFISAGLKLPFVQKDDKKELPPVESSDEDDDTY